MAEPVSIELNPIILYARGREQKIGTIFINEEEGTVKTTRDIKPKELEKVLIGQGYILGKKLETKGGYNIFKIEKAEIKEIDLSGEPLVIEVKAEETKRETPTQKACKGGTYDAINDVCELPPMVIRGTVR